jgi:hypothetical protein
MANVGLWYHTGPMSHDPDWADQGSAPVGVLARPGSIADSAVNALSKAERREVGVAVILGRPAPSHLEPAASAYARQYLWWSWMGGVFAFLGISVLTIGALDTAIPNAQTVIEGGALIMMGLIWLTLGQRARRVARGSQAAA